MAKLAIAVVLGLLITGCATAPNGSPQTDVLLQRDRDWAVVAGGGRDIDGVVSFWTDDATVVPPDKPAIHGKAAIREYVQQSLAIPGFQIHWHPTSAAVSADGTLGYTVGENAVVVPGADGKLVTLSGRYTTVWRREKDGQWKCVVDIWNSGP